MTRFSWLIPTLAVVAACGSSTNDAGASRASHSEGAGTHGASSGPRLTDAGAAGPVIVGQGSNPVASTATSTSSETAGSGATTGAASGAADAGGSSTSSVPDASPASNLGEAGACVDTYLACEKGRLCCGGVDCTGNACGGCFAEGVTCGHPHDAPCCNGLTCNHGFCGTNLCSPDGTSCADAGVVCCNDDCNNGTCGG